MIAIGGALFYIGLPVLAISVALGRNDETSNRYLWAAGVGFVMIVAGGILMGELRL